MMALLIIMAMGAYCSAGFILSVLDKRGTLPSYWRDEWRDEWGLFCWVIGWPIGLFCLVVMTIGEITDTLSDKFNSEFDKP